jgi:hypothetical protein
MCLVKGENMKKELGEEGTAMFSSSVTAKENPPVIEQMVMLSLNISNLMSLVNDFSIRIKSVRSCVKKSVEKEENKMPDVCELAQSLIACNCKLENLIETMQTLISSLEI